VIEVTKQTVQHVAELANLRLTEEEIAHYETQLGKILSYIQMLEKLDGSPLEKKTQESTPERNDNVVESLSVELSLSQAPQKIGTAFQVPRILE